MTDLNCITNIMWILISQTVLVRYKNTTRLEWMFPQTNQENIIKPERCLKRIVSGHVIL